MRHFHAKRVRMTREGMADVRKTWGFGQKPAWHILCLRSSGPVPDAVKRDERKMRTLLRKTSTGLYFEGPDRWTSDPTGAYNFKLIDRALEFVERWNLKDMELVFAFDDEDVTRVPLEKMELRYSEA
jgi:hypothetical protein